jgi:very-short-patch-repair endonuclease
MMTGMQDADALRATISLMDYLAEVTDAAERDPVRDILADESGAPEDVLWLDELPSGVHITPLAHDDILLRIAPPKTVPEPRPPAQLAGWIDSGALRGVDGPEPSLLDAGPTDTDESLRTTPPVAVRRLFEGWRTAWRNWSVQQRLSERRRHVYGVLEQAAKLMEQQDDVYEFVLCRGLIRWEAPSGERIRRHLVSEQAVPKLDRATAEVTVTMGAGRRRLEDREVLGGEDAYEPDRARSARQALLDDDSQLLDPAVLNLLEEWLGVCLTTPFESADDPVLVGRGLPANPTLSSAPALVLRPRSRVRLAEAYRDIAEQLREPDAEVPVALAQLVVDTEQNQRAAWLNAQGAASGDVLGTDPLFPLPTNDEQQRVIELLRTETGVVVQGPPGTGKTHTIANLVSALLARGQRVLVTSQKDQALRVLREKIPPELRRLCVLLAGGSKDAAKELEQGLDALSEAQASASSAALPDLIAELGAHRRFLRSRSAELNQQIRDLRDVENVRHQPVVPGFSTDRYLGSLTEIVRDVKAGTARYQWIPAVPLEQPDVPPLSIDELVVLVRLLRTDTAARRNRAHQRVPGLDEVPSAPALAEIVAAECRAQQTAHEDTSELTQRLSALGADQLQGLAQVRDQVNTVLHRLGLVETARPAAPDWVRSALADRLAGRHAGLWAHLLQVRAEAGRLQQQLREQGVRFVIELPPLEQIGIGRARGMVNAGLQLRDHLRQGRKLRSILPKSAVEKNAADLLSVVLVDGRPPTDLPHLEAALERLEAEVAAAQLVAVWAEAGVVIPAAGLTRTLSELDDDGRRLADVDHLAGLVGHCAGVLRHNHLTVDLSSLDGVRRILDAVPAALKYVALNDARTQVDQLAATVRLLSADPAACPELAGLLTAILARDITQYTAALTDLDGIRRDQELERQRARLLRTMTAVHPQLANLLATTAIDPAWDDRVGVLGAAWAWSKAEQYVQKWRNAEQERRLVGDYDRTEDQLKLVTERLAAAEAVHACMNRMTDAHARALRSYREHMSHVGAGTGVKAREYRKAARAAMEKAKDAVPAWVVPLPNLLDNIAPRRNAFDVVIVDEASQVGLENLFLLWMAPRVIVVGDDKQCTPSGNRLGKLDQLFESLAEHLGDLDQDVRHHFTSKSNLYGVLSARSGKDAVVRLREHFRCMPEIINWSSNQFYGEDGLPGLIPLRERTADDLVPLQVVQVAGAYTEGRNQMRRNEVEIKQIVAKLVECLGDPRYRNKTFGVVVLQSSSAQVKMLDLEIMAATTPEQREAHKIRVGTPPNFQGDERDVIFLSMVVAEPPRAHYALAAQQSYNVAASRAKDQMWLFTSVRPRDLKPDDLRSSLMNYMMDPPSVFGASPALADVSPTHLCTPFDSMFEQLVYRYIKQRGYHAVPQYKVGSRALDIVVVGDGGRIAVECDGHHWHTTPGQQVSDARRDRELRRMGWEVLRIRESEFEFDAEHELEPLWTRLADRGIHPRELANHEQTWNPIELPDATDDAIGEDA